MNNPFSNRTTITSGEYLEKKKRLSKISHLKQSIYANYKTANYIVTSNTSKEKILPQRKYPQEIPFDLRTIPFFEPQETKEETKKETSQVQNPKCKKCFNTLSLMKKSPKHWICDGWNPPNTHCLGGNNIQLGENDKAYCCYNVKHCNWIICEKCYNSICLQNTKNMKQKKEEEQIKKEKRINEEEQEIMELERIEQEKIKMLKKEIEYYRNIAPTLKCIKSYQEYLDLAKGFQDTEPFCETSYEDICQNIENGKLLSQMCDANYSSIDMGKECLYEKRDLIEKDNVGNDRVVVIKDFVINKCRTDKGLLNLRGTIIPKNKIEHTFKFPVTLKKTHFCGLEIDKQQPDHHKVGKNQTHTHWFPTRNTFIKYTHVGNEKIPFHISKLQGDMTAQAKRSVVDKSKKCGGCGAGRIGRQMLFQIK